MYTMMDSGAQHFVVVVQDGLQTPRDSALDNRFQKMDGCYFIIGSMHTRLPDSRIPGEHTLCKFTP